MSNEATAKPTGQLRILYEMRDIFVICTFRLSFSFVYILTFEIRDVMSSSFVNLIFKHLTWIELFIKVVNTLFGIVNIYLFLTPWI